MVWALKLLPNYFKLRFRDRIMTVKVVNHNMVYCTFIKRERLLVFNSH
jgi:hypothetical protein